MIRPFTLIAMLLAALSGAYLFAVKHQAQVLDNEIAALSQSSRLDAMRIRVLQGQWSLETDPTRLQQLAAQFTTLQPMQPAQLVTLASLKTGLPAPGSPAPPANPALPDQTVPQLSDVAQNTIAPNGLPFPPPPAPAPGTEMLASLAAPSLTVPSLAVPVVSHPVARRVSHSALHIENTQVAESLPPPKPFTQHAPRREVQPVQSTAVAQNMPVGAQVMSVKATAMVQQYTPAAAQNGGSVLGMASNVPPPQPMPQNGNDN